MPKRRKGAAPELSRNIIRLNQSDNLALLRPVRQTLREIKAAEKELVTQQGSGARADVALISGAAVSALTTALITWLRGLITPQQAQQIAEKQVARTTRFGSLTFASWAEAIGADPKAPSVAAMVDTVISQHIQDNARYITSIPAQLADQVAEKVNEAVLKGTTPQLSDILQDRLGVAESRAKIIARDQTNKAQGQIQKVRQQSLGITHYEWVTAGDERVRPSHSALNGKVFAWDAPPDIGHPGEPIMCRCVAAPIFDYDGTDD